MNLDTESVIETMNSLKSRINKNAKHQQDLVQHEYEVCRCIPAGTHGSTPHLLKTIVLEEVEISGGGHMSTIEEPFIVASRGRNPENPSDRTVGAPTEQRLEPNCQGICNTLTTVLKDNYVVEPKIDVIGNYSPSGHDASRIVHPDGLAPTVKENHGTVTATVAPEPRLRIRKLTPKECYRLMGFDDESFHKAEATCSNTQLYKQAGNSIVVDVLEHLFMNLKPYLYTSV